MKPTFFLLLLACCLLFIPFAVLRYLSEPQSSLVLTPATCAALVPLGLTLPVVPGGCLYSGPVSRNLRSISLGGIWVARSAVLAEAPPLESNKP